jgi:hypothetical protein
MRTLGWLCALLVNATLACGAILYVFEPEPSVRERAFAGATGSVLLFIVILLLLARFGPLPRWAPKAMSLVCVAIPIVFILGSLDLGIISGLEIISIVFASAFAWGTWFAFSLYSSKA